MSKKKYIDYGKLLEERYRLGLDEMSRISKVNAFNHFIDTMPSADVEEVKHGNWIDVPLNVYNDRDGMNKYNLRTKCSVCEYAMPREYPRFNICPNCGAKMGKGQEC